MKNTRALLWAFSAAALIAVGCGGSKEPISLVETDDGEVSFQSTVMPIMKDHCVSCHGSKGDLSVESYEALMKGGESGPSVVPGKPDESLLVKTVEKTDGPSMPPFLFHSLTDDRIRAIRDWVEEGAKNN